MERALALIGDPHLRLRAIHIAGTKGKGSVAAMLDSLPARRRLSMRPLYQAPSGQPHRAHPDRRRRDSVRLDARVYRAAARDLRARGLGLTFFEFTVALMFLYFAEAGVDIAVIETGLGGRLDSTNVVTAVASA